MSTDPPPVAHCISASDDPRLAFSENIIIRSVYPVGSDPELGRLKFATVPLDAVWVSMSSYMPV